MTANDMVISAINRVNIQAVSRPGMDQARKLKMALLEAINAVDFLIQEIENAEKRPS